MRLDIRRPLARWSLPAVVLAVGVAWLLGATGAAAVPAPPATLSVNAACYVIAGRNAPPMSFTGRGFVAGDAVLIASEDGTVDTSVRADSEGRISGRADAPTPYFATPGAKRIALTATDQTPAAAKRTATTNVSVTELGWEHGSTKRAPGLRALTEKTNWRFSGFIPGEPIFGHYVYNGRQVARQRFGRAQAPCGTLKVRARLYPATPHHTTYSIQYDDSRLYSKRSRPRIVGPLKLSL